MSLTWFWQRVKPASNPGTDATRFTTWWHSGSGSQANNITAGVCTTFRYWRGIKLTHGPGLGVIYLISGARPQLALWYFNYPNPRYISLADAAWKHPKYPCCCILPREFEGNIDIHKHENSEVIYSNRNWLSLQHLVSWINHLPAACWSTFWKSIFKHQLGCRLDIIDSISFFFFWHMQLYMSWYIISFLALSLFFKYSLFFQVLLY